MQSGDLVLLEVHEELGERSAATWRWKRSTSEKCLCTCGVAATSATFRSGCRHARTRLRVDEGYVVREPHDQRLHAAVPSVPVGDGCGVAGF